MDNVLRETIATEIKTTVGKKESKNEASKTETKKYKEKLTRDWVGYFQGLDQRLHQILITQGR